MDVHIAKAEDTRVCCVSRCFEPGSFSMYNILDVQASSTYRPTSPALIFRAVAHGAVAQGFSGPESAGLT